MQPYYTAGWLRVGSSLCYNQWHKKCSDPRHHTSEDRLSSLCCPTGHDPRMGCRRRLPPVLDAGRETSMSELFSFGAWVRRRRRALDLTREELAAQVGCSVMTIRRIETDERRPSKQLAARLADFLHIVASERPAFLQTARGQLATDRLAAPAAGVERSIAGGPALAERATPAPSLPSGTVTFLFTDIEGSTQRWEQHPDAMPAALARHDAILREVIAAHRGGIVKTTGDGIHAVFARAADALTAAVMAQRALQREEWGAIGSLRVRMALHTGVAEERNRDYFGPPLNRAARLLAAGHGGQILLS